MTYDLTTAQKNMYATQQFFANTSICNVGGYMFFDKKIDNLLLKQVINRLLKNADGLRVRLKIEEMSVSQYIEEYKEYNVEVLKFTQQDFEKKLEEEMKKSFNMGESLYEFKIIELEEKTGVYIKLHHIISDAWSIALIGTKIEQYYNLLEKGEEIPNDIFSYEKFIVNEKKYFESDKYLTDEIFWQEKYKEKPVYVTMAPNINSNSDIKAMRMSVDVCSSDTKTIYDFCGKQNISVAVLFEAVVMLYAARINNAESATLCSVIINRNGFEEKNTIGMFNSILPLTISLDYKETFLSLCANIVTEHYQLFRHQKYPLEKIMNYVREKHEKDTILYDIMVSYQNAEINKANIASAKWIFNGTSDLGFMVNISDFSKNGKLHIDFDFRKNYFDEEEITRIYNRFLYMIHQIINDESILLKNIEIVTPDEKKQILNEFNNTKKKYPTNRCITSYLEENVIKNPDKKALIFNSRTLSYNEFNEKVNSLAHYITERVKDRNVIIGVMFERSFEMMIAIYAVLKAGHSYMPIDPHFPIERIGFMIEDSKTPLVMMQGKWSNLVSEGVEKVNIDSFEYLKYDNTNLNIKISATDVAYVIYTSGSTGKPKGAMIEHHSAINRIKWMHEKYPLLDGDVILQKTPYTFDVSVWELFWWSMYDGTLQILMPEGHKDPIEIVKGISEGNVTHIHFVPSMLNMFLEYLNVNIAAVEKIKTLKYVFASGEALQSEQVKLFYKLLEKNRTTLHNLYGPTECAVDVSYYDCDKSNIPNSIPIGKPIDNTELIVLDKNEMLLPIGVVGELYISGVQVGRGYINREELTKEKFVPNNYFTSKTMYKTGDLSMWLPDGNIEYCGRTDFQIKIRGLRVELGDIENAILKYPGVNQTLVAVIEIKGEKELCVYYTASKKIDISEIKIYLGKLLPEYMVPSYYVLLEKMPTNENGKVNRKALPLPEIEKKEEKYVEAKTQTEKIVQETICDVLKVARISCETNIFDYGLSSLDVISALVKLSSKGYELKVRDFYEKKTIVKLSELLDELQKENTSNNIEDEYKEDIDLYSDISDINKHLQTAKISNSIFLTGATSFLGIHIINELMLNTNKTIYCLIRNEDKFKRFIANYTNIEYPNSRIICVKGDITKVDLGMNSVSAENIKNVISDVIHCAADVSFFCEWENSKNINYIGTCNVLKFAQESKAKLHHISTMSVSGDILTKQTRRYPEFTENKLYIGQLYKENVYAYSKYLAEKEVIKAIREERINASIYRIANLTWRVSDGKFQENPNINDLYLLTKVMLKYKKMPLELMNENISLTPVDDCTRAITTLMNVNKNKVFNLYSQNSMTIKEYIEALDKVEPIEIKKFYEMLKNDKNIEAQFVLMYIAGIIDGGRNAVVKISNEETNKELDLLGYKWSKLDKKYINRYTKI